MSQHRNTDLDAGRAANAIPEQQILDAAYDLLLAVGMRKMSIADIARQAGVSRATLYRRWPNVNAIVGALITREFAQLGAVTFGRPKQKQDARAAVVDAVVATVRAVRDHPLTRKIIEVDPEFLLPYLLERRGTSTTAQLELLTAELKRNDGSVRRGNRAAQARALWLAAWSFTLTGPVLADDTVSIAMLDRELRAMLDRYLTP
jgi:AcrR family transcriptional regulator